MKLASVRVPRSLTALAVPVVVAAVLVGGAVTAAVASRPTVHITVQPRAAETTVPISVVDPKSAAPDDVPGLIRETTVDVTGTAPATGTTEISNRAQGTVRIENHWNQVQPLAATTRLRSAGGVLFRTTRRVDVPAGASADVEVQADQPGETGNIGPDRFTIVALWAGLQEKIFGTSITPMTGGGGTAAVVTESDLTQAEAAAMAEARRAAVAALAKDPPAGTALEANAVSATTKRTLGHTEIGTVAAEASVRLRVTVRGLITDAAKLTAAVTAAVRREFPGETPTGFSSTPELEDVLLPGGPFPVAVKLTLAPDDRSLAADRIAGKTRDAAAAQLNRTPGVTAVRITGLPLWSRVLPPPDRIRIVITPSAAP
jgi:hypothetical protein